MPRLFDGAYINLDRSADRRKRMEQQLERLALVDVYARFPAVDGNALPAKPGVLPGERGIFRSHMNVIAEARNRGRPLHVLEDDAILSANAAPAIELAIRSGALRAYDLIFTETLVPQDVRALKTFKSLYDQAVKKDDPFDVKKLQMIDMQPLRFACATSYIVNPNSLERLSARYKVGWDRGPAQPFDLFLRDEVNAGRIRAACMFPFVTTVERDTVTPTTISRPPPSAEESDTGVVLGLLRQSFFVGCDFTAAHAEMDEVRARSIGRRPDTQLDLLEKAMGFVISDHFRVR
jgi:hypothetical protein